MTALARSDALGGSFFTHSLVSIPNGDLSVIIEKALTDLCDKVEARRLGKKRGRAPATKAPAEEAEHREVVTAPASASASALASADTTAPRADAANGDSTPVAAPGQPRPATKKCSRHISNADRRQVIAREGLQCSFVYVRLAAQVESGRMNPAPTTAQVDS